ncbi:MAG: transposase [Patescibacteria group bacterium]
MQRKFEFSVDEYYHIFNRGTDKRIIFVDDYDREYFITLLYLCNSARPIDSREIKKAGDPFLFERGGRLVFIGAWCLIPNHFHLLVKEAIEGGVSKFILKIGTAYSSYFNRRHGRSGHLFQGPFQARHVADDRYLEYLYAYIHINSVDLYLPGWKEKGFKDSKASMKFMEKYPFSSYSDYRGVDRVWGKILDQQQFPDYFSEENSFENLVKGFLEWETEVDA